MRRVSSVILGIFAIVFLTALPNAQAPSPTAAAPQAVTFASDIQPILEKNCASCHSGDLKLAELDLSNRDAAMRGGEHGAVIVAGNSEKSKLYRMVAGLDQPVMPMQGDPLKPTEVAAIKSWIDQGANWETTAVSFAKDIQPIMERSCWNCHGAAMQMSKLDLRTREGAIRGGAHGSAITPGNSEQSRLYRAVAHLDAIKMPMQGDQLKPEEIAAVKAWIDAGAPWDVSTTTTTAKPASNAIAALENMELTPEQRNYWAFQLPVQKTPPVVSKAEFSHPIDRFLEATRAEKKLVVAPRADKRTLVRRAYMDLIGLPPSPADVEAFVANQSDTAWDDLITKLLASPQYGERWGRHWLDVARYADSNGFEQDYDRPNAWRYRDYVIKAFNEDKPYNQFLKEQIAGDELDYVTHETLIATGFLRAGPRVLFREKDNPERRWDYVDDLITTLGRGVMGMTVNCARCHNHKFDPIAQKDYYSIAAALNGWVETDWPLVASRAEAEAYLKKNQDVDSRIRVLRDKIGAIEKPYRDELRAVYIKKEYPENVQRAVFKPEAERTPGEQLLATQVLTGGGGGTDAEIEKKMTAAELAQKKELASQIAAIEKQRPKAPPMAEIITDGDWRFAPMGRGDETIGCPKCRLPPPDRPNGTFLQEGPGKYEPPPTNFLIRGDPESKGSLMKPGFLNVALHGEHPTEIPRPDGRTSGRRLALAEWLGSNDNPLTARVIVNRVWHHHFGRGIVATLDNFGKMGEQPTHPELLDYLAVEFMKRGWSIKQLHRFMMTSEAYQMASVFDHGADVKADPENRLLWRYRPQRLDAETIRDAMLSVAGNINPAMGGPAFFPFVPKEILVTEQTKGRWDTQPEGPATWRRSIYIYQRRSLPFPMFETFDHPDMNLTAGARNVSTVPTQALTLLNNPFVLREAELLAERIISQVGADPAKQIDLGYQYALGRPATDLERSLALEKVKAGSLVDFTHVLLNLSEFLYMR